MAKITVGGKPAQTSGNLPAVGSAAPDFLLTKGDLSDVSLKDFQGKRKILNIVTSLDTGVCATSAKKFEAELSKLSNTVVLTVSCDLPFETRKGPLGAGYGYEYLTEVRTTRTDEAWSAEWRDGPDRALKVWVADASETEVMACASPVNADTGPDADEMQKWLQGWVMQYVDGAPAHSSEETKARRPLAAAEVTVEEDPTNPGYYSSNFFLRPHYQLEGLTVSLRLVSKLPSAKGA